MSTNKHTAGPWTYKATASLGPQYAVYPENEGYDIAIVYDHGNAEANAKLIAQAPALLAENARLREWMEQLKQTATSVLSYSKESSEPLQTVLSADSKMKENKFRKALSSILEELERRPSNVTGFITQAQVIEAIARAALQGGGL